MSSDDGLSDFDDDSQLSTDFAAAAKYLQGIVATLDQSTLLELYGLYKQATVGKCNVPKPGLFALQAKAKWNAWNDLADMTGEIAMQKYVDKMSSIRPDWNVNAAQGGGAKQASWVSVSRMVTEESDDHLDPVAKTCFDFVKEGNATGLQQAIADGELQLDALDDEGMALLHWAADRGCVDVLRLLLASGADVNVTDEDGQTPLHFASSVGHVDCVRLLLDGGADKARRDQDDQTGYDVATDQAIRDMLL